MSEDKTSIINFATEVKKRTGKVLDEKQIADGVPKRVRANPEEDIVAFVALEVLKLIRDKTDRNPVAVIAGLQAAGNALSEQLISKYGLEKSQKMAVSATVISQQYKPEYSDGGE